MEYFGFTSQLHSQPGFPGVDKRLNDSPLFIRKINDQEHARGRLTGLR